MTMELTDIHTHNAAPAPHTIYNSGSIYTPDKNISIGIHPWHINGRWERELAAVAEWAKADNVVAIGECGLDMLKSPASLELQEEVFRAHIRLSEALRKPLIVHCVKAHDRLIALHREAKPSQTWIAHGFRGKPMQAAQLTKAGLYISLGEKFNPDSARTIPADRLFIESDESRCSIEEIYSAVAAAKETAVEELALQTMQNVARCGIIL